jgi:hypothetical protein
MDLPKIRTVSKPRIRGDTGGIALERSFVVGLAWWMVDSIGDAPPVLLLVP